MIEGIVVKLSDVLYQTKKFIALVYQWWFTIPPFEENPFYHYELYEDWMTYVDNPEWDYAESVLERINLYGKSRLAKVLNLPWKLRNLFHA